MTTIRTDLPIPNGNDDLAWTKLLDAKPVLHHPVAPVIIKIDTASLKDTPSTPDTPKLTERKSSFFDAFNRQLRSSIKIVTDSPGPITR